MICQPCRDRHHENCPGGTHCPCQHRPPGTATPEWTQAGEEA